MERKQGFFSSLKEEVVRGLSPRKFASRRRRSSGRSRSPITALINRRRRNHRAAIPEILIARSGSLRPLEALSPLWEGLDRGGAHETRVEGGVWAHLMKRNVSVSSGSSACKRSDLRLLLGVLGAPLATVHVSPNEPFPHLIIKDTPIFSKQTQKKMWCRRSQQALWCFTAAAASQDIASAEDFTSGEDQKHGAQRLDRR